MISYFNQGTALIYIFVRPKMKISIFKTFIAFLL